MELKEERGDPNSTLLFGAVTVNDFLFTVTVELAVELSHLPDSVGVNNRRIVVVPAPTMVALSPEIEITDVLLEENENVPGTDAVTVSNLNEGFPYTFVVLAG
jgi:hypothetical protein